MKALWFAALLGLTLCWPSAATAESNTTAVEYDQQHVEQLHASLLAAFKLIDAKDQDVAAIAAAMRPILADPSFSFLAEADRHAAYLVQGEVLFSLKDYSGAQPLLQQASEMPEADENDWGYRMRNAYLLHAWKVAAQSVTALAQNWPEKLADYDDEAFFRIVIELDKAPDLAAVEGEMLKVLHGIQWHPTDPFQTADILWFSLTRLHLEQDEPAGAVAVAADLRDPISALDLRIDKRFDPVIEADPNNFDVMKMCQARLADIRVKSAAAPTKFEGMNTIAEMLLMLDRPEEALATATDALTRYKANPNAFTDGTDYMNWTHDIRSRALFALGRSDEALADIAEGAKQHENGRENVSQKINLADEYVAYDRPKDALGAVEGVEAAQPSAYGLMALADARARAYFELGDHPSLNKTLAFMKAHASDGIRPYLNVLLLTGNQDAAAAELIATLRDPTQRLQALRWVQNYLPQRHPSAREQSEHAAWIAVRDRADVQVEIAKVGHIGTYPLQGSSF